MKDGPSGNKLLCNYDRMRHEIKAGDVILVEGRSRVSEVIKTLTKSPWSHSALYIGQVNSIEDADTRELIKKHMGSLEEHEPLLLEGVLGKGFIVTPLSFYQDDHMRISRPSGITYSDLQKVITYAARSLGKKYSAKHIFDLLRFLLPWRVIPRFIGSRLVKYKKGTITEEICSSMIADAFESVNFPILPSLRKNGNQVELIKRNPLLITPSDFDYSPFFKIVKYPIFVNTEGIYRSLLWNQDEVSNEHTHKS
tara:strand:+ start:1105 stop:1863 length:759 start_codon:yes stop_codon:yes gene_type:complete